MKSFAEDVYYSSIEYGPQDVRTSLGYFNLAKVFQNQGALVESKAFMRKVVSIWLNALIELVIKQTTDSFIPVVMSQVYEVVDMLIDIRNTFTSAPSEISNSMTAEVELAIGLALIHVNNSTNNNSIIGRNDNHSEAMEYLFRAREGYKSINNGDSSKYDIVDIANAAEEMLSL